MAMGSIFRRVECLAMDTLGSARRAMANEECSCVACLSVKVVKEVQQ
jgi:hypothetical protein